MPGTELKSLVDSLKAFGSGETDEALKETAHAPWVRPPNMEGPATDFGVAEKNEYARLLVKAASDSREEQYGVDPSKLTTVGDTYYFLRSAMSAARLYNRGRVDDAAIGLSEKRGYKEGGLDYLYRIDKTDMAVIGRKTE